MCRQPGQEEVHFQQADFKFEVERFVNILKGQKGSFNCPCIRSELCRKFPVIHYSRIKGCFE